MERRISKISEAAGVEFERLGDFYRQGSSKVQKTEEYVIYRDKNTTISKCIPATAKNENNDGGYRRFSNRKLSKTQYIQNLDQIIDIKESFDKKPQMPELFALNQRTNTSSHNISSVEKYIDEQYNNVIGRVGQDNDDNDVVVINQPQITEIEKSSLKIESVHQNNINLSSRRSSNSKISTISNSLSNLKKSIIETAKSTSQILLDKIGQLDGSASNNSQNKVVISVTENTYSRRLPKEILNFSHDADQILNHSGSSAGRSTEYEMLKKPVMAPLLKQISDPKEVKLEDIKTVVEIDSDDTISISNSLASSTFIQAVLSSRPQKSSQEREQKVSQPLSRNQSRVSDKIKPICANFSSSCSQKTQNSSVQSPVLPPRPILRKDTREIVRSPRKLDIQPLLKYQNGDGNDDDNDVDSSRYLLDNRSRQNTFYSCRTDGTGSQEDFFSCDEEFFEAVADQPEHIFRPSDDIENINNNNNTQNSENLKNRQISYEV